MSDERKSQRNRRTRSWRLALMVILTLVVAGFGVYTITMPWYEFKLPSTAVADSNFQKTEGISANLTATGRDLVKRDPVPSLENMSQPTLVPPKPASVLGIPQPAFFLGALLAFVLVGALVQVGFVSGVGVVCGFFGWRQFTALRTIIEDPNFGGAYNHPLNGLSLFQMALIASMLLGAMVTFQIVMVNSERKREEKEEARKNGQPIEPSFFEVLWANMVMSPLARTGSVPVRSAKAHETAATGKTPQVEKVKM